MRRIFTLASREPYRSFTQREIFYPPNQPMPERSPSVEDVHPKHQVSATRPTVSKLKVNRLVLVIVVTFLIADTCPHPNLSPGLVEFLSKRAMTILNSQSH
jgi:hypothetical protein